jgi:hypothetical protein
MKISIFAEKGMILTDGKEYNDAFSLAKDRSPDEYTEITIEEYEKRMAEQEKVLEEVDS